MADVRTGLRTEEELTSEPYGFRVTWIDWDSPFRDTDLAIGDLVVAVDGEPYAREGRETAAPRAVGQYHETMHWADRGAADGDPVTLRVLRWPDGEALDLEIAGTLREEVFYQDAKERRALGPGGPPRTGTSSEDGAFAGWASWYETFTKRSAYVLDDGWNRGSFNNRRELTTHQDDRERLDYLLESYPGPFADAAAADWERVREVLEGARFDITDDDLVYRELGEKRREQARETSRAAWDAFLEELGDETIDTFPAADPIRGDRSAVTGKVVVWPWITPRGGLIERFGRSFAVAGAHREGFYFAPLDAPEMRRFFDAFFRYRAKVDPLVAERYRFVGRVLDDPVLLTADGRPAPGLLVEVIGGMAGAGDGDCFVDLRDPEPAPEDATALAREVGRSPFAGEAELLAVDVPELTAGSSPAEVVTTMIQAVKWADQATWESVFADWRVLSGWGGAPVVDLAYGPSRGNLDRQWGEARRQILDYLYDARVAEVGRVRTLRGPNDGGPDDGGPDEGGPAVDQVDVIVDHVGLAEPGNGGGPEYRAFVDSRVYRRWRLQRLDGGPWRVTEVRRL